MMQKLGLFSPLGYDILHMNKIVPKALIAIRYNLKNNYASYHMSFKKFANL